MALQHLRSSTADKRPTPAAMADGQLGVNTNAASPGVFFKTSTGTLIKAGPVHIGATAPNATPASGGATGNTIGEQWLDNSGSPAILKTWNGTSWISSGTVTSVTGTSPIVVATGTTTPAISIQAATTSQSGAVQLTDSTSSTSTTTAATPNSVKTAYDLANAALPKAGGTLTGNVDNSATGYFDLPSGTTAQRPGTANSGMIRYNSDIGKFEGYTTTWGSIGGGATGAGGDDVFYENGQTVTTNYTLTAGKNAMSAGPITINSGVTVTVGSGQSWVIV
jgi:hypothetical protein